MGGWVVYECKKCQWKIYHFRRIVEDVRKARPNLYNHNVSYHDYRLDIHYYRELDWFTKTKIDELPEGDLVMTDNSPHGSHPHESFVHRGRGTPSSR